MANLFADLPATAGNGVGAGVDVSAMGGEKTITVQDSFSGAVIIEISCDAGASWAQLAAFYAPGKKVLPVAAEQMRVRRSGVGSIAGLPNVDVAANDNGAQFVSLVAPAGDGQGAAVDTSVLGTYNTVTVLGDYDGIVNILISDDGTDYSTCFSFSGPGVQSKEFTAQFMRVERAGVTGVGTPIVAVGAINDATSPESSSVASVNFSDENNILANQVFS